MKCAWHRVSAMWVHAGFGRLAIINRKQDLSLWGQKNLVNRSRLEIRWPGFSSQLIILHWPCDLGQVSALLGLQNYNDSAALGVCERGPCDVAVGICRVLFSKGLLGAWPILQSFCRWAGPGTPMETQQAQNGRAVPAPMTVLNQKMNPLKYTHNWEII